MKLNDFIGRFTGSGSVYDLRHFSLGIAPNIARWDYHVTHINQLLLLATIDDDPIFTQVIEYLLCRFKRVELILYF